MKFYSEKNNDRRKTTLNNIHEALGAKMIPFTGLNMPLQYGGVNAEQETVREAVGILMFLIM